MESLGISSAYHFTACEFVNNYNLIVADKVVNILLHNTAGTECLVYVMIKLCVFRV